MSPIRPLSHLSNRKNSSRRTSRIQRQPLRTVLPSEGIVRERLEGLGWAKKGLAGSATCADATTARYGRVGRMMHGAGAAVRDSEHEPESSSLPTHPGSGVVRTRYGLTGPFRHPPGAAASGQ